MSPARKDLRGLSVAVLGPGAVGAAFADALAARGADVRLWGRRPGAAARARRRLGGPDGIRATARLGRALAGAELVLACVGDDGLEEVAARVGAELARPGAGAAPAVLHTNGLRGPDALALAAAAGAACGVLHPLAPLAPIPGGPGGVRGAGGVGGASGGTGGAPGRGVAGAWFAVAGAPRAVRVARRVVRALGGRALELEEGADAQAAYHAAASLASGGLVVLFDAALGPLAGAVRAPEDARAALLDLLARTLANLEERGAGDALTGAAARGSAELVGAHVDALLAAERALGGEHGGEHGGGAAELYALCVRRMVALAQASGRLDARAARAVLARLDRARRA